MHVVGILTKIALLGMSCFLNGDDEQDLNNDDDDGDYRDHYDDHDDQECILLACCPRSFRVNLINASYECTLYRARPHNRPNHEDNGDDDVVRTILKIKLLPLFIETPC